MKGELGCAKSLACDDEVDEVWKESLWWIRGYIRRNAFILTMQLLLLPLECLYLVSSMFVLQFLHYYF